MRILVLNYEFPPLGWGAANATYHILREFSKYEDLNITLITSSIWEYKEEVFSENIKIYYLDIGKKWQNLHNQNTKDLLRYSQKAYSFAKKLCKNQDIDIVHAFFGVPCGYIAMKLKDKLNIPYIVSLRGADVPFYEQKWKNLDKFLFRWLTPKIWQKASKVIANSKWLKDLALETSPQQKIDIIPNWIDLEKFGISSKNKDKDIFNILFLSRLTERKWIHYLLDAFYNFAREKEDVKLTLVWDGKLKEYIQNYVKENKIEEKVDIVWGISPEYTPYYYSISDIYILPSSNEWMSNTVLEAMASGLPVILTDVWWTKELFDRNWWIVEKESSEDIQRKFEEAYDLFRNGKLQEIWKKSYERAKELSGDNVAKQYLEVYRESAKC